LITATLAALMAAPARLVFDGVVTDSMCPTGDHSGMRMGPTDAECTIACVNAHGAELVLYTGGKAWKLSDQKLAEKFAGRKVRVTGHLDEKAGVIQVDSIVPAK
jgi:Protein of unknown function (DUF5818)